MSMRYATLAAALVLAAAPVARAADGAAVYKEQCAKCHGETGHADTTVAKTLKVAPLAGDAKVAGMTEAQVVERIKSNEKHPQKIRGLSDDDLAAAAGFAKQLAAGH
ncbi:c-type cytochrome [Candidatus Binatia bacterium]|nr:c-type cytochrome [Candidatus Binatia bacterium]